jgi:putative MFS transporter
VSATSRSRPRAVARGPLDVLIILAATLYVVAALGLRYRLWAQVEPVLLVSVAEFAAGFARLGRLARATLLPLGTLTTVLVLVALVREGGLRVRRGRLRIAAIVALVGAGLIGAVLLEPLEHAILQAAATGSAAELLPLVRRWETWQRAVLAAGVAAGVALVLADRAPRPAEPSGIPEALTSHHRTLLLLLGTATLFEGYDRFIASLALPHIGRELGGTEGELGWALSAIRVGALLALPLGHAGDRFGRRRMLLVTVLGYTLATGATGFSRGLLDFVLFQVVAMAFLAAELSLAQVVVAEEFPAAARGVGQGLLGAAAALGAGLAALLFPALAESPLGWRGLYFVGIVPLLLVGYLRRSLPETARWRHLAARDRQAANVLSVLRPAHRWRFVVLMTVTAGATAAVGSAFGFASYRAITDFGWTPGQVSGMVLTGGGLGFFGWMLFGRLADLAGRRLIGSTALVGGALAVCLYYRSPYLMLAFTALVFFESGVTISINALATEVFPTALRAVAKSWITNAAIIGSMVGLGLVGLLAGRVGGHEKVIAGLGVVPALLAPLLFLLPETRRQELEVTSGEAA